MFAFLKMNYQVGAGVYIINSTEITMTPISLLNIMVAGQGATGNFDAGIKLPKIANESTHFIASILMDIVKFVTRIFGLAQDENVVSVLYIVLVVGIALAIGAAIKWIVIGIVRAITRHKPYSFMMLLTRGNFFTKITRIIPPVVVIVLIQFALSTESTAVKWFEKFLWMYIICCFALSINTLIDVIWMHIDSRDNKKRLPLKGLAQVARVIIWFIAGIIVVGIIVNKSPAALLAGLGAFAAVLMLVFKDSILGVVAGVQLSENDMLRVGDWIVVDGTTANGNVTEVSLTSVKVLNWDKTTTTLPPYSLVSGSFQNYRTMQTSGTRRICRTYFIDADTVRFLSPEMLTTFESIPFMKDYITRKLEQRNAGKEQNVNNPDGLADGTIDTNLGLFRAYVKMYLDSLPSISHNDTCFVNTLQQTANGIPFQIYCFTATSSWIPYEGIQSEIFEHIAAVLPRFGLYVFENASGRDEINNGYLEANGNPAKLYGLPYPFMPGIDGVPAEQAGATKA